MNHEQIRLLARSLPDSELIETHISWVILSGIFAYKIKKPLRFPFLDFSTLEARKHFCEEEIRLNRRLAPDTYLALLPVSDGLAWEEPAIEYAVQMKRINTELQMDRMIRANRVASSHVQEIAAILADFHQTARIHNPQQGASASVWRDFADLFEHRAIYEKALGAQAFSRLNTLAEKVKHQLHTLDERLVARAKAGFWIDGHGDLHCRNIFLSEPPVIFDCIEFDAHFRIMDVLSELAFLVMDLEYLGRPDLAEQFLSAYQSHWEVMPEAEADRWLFDFFKAYRANVRLKIGLFDFDQHPDTGRQEVIQGYSRLLMGYAEQLVG